MTDEKRVQVRYFTCNCEWTSKYCDEYHTAIAQVPLSVLKTYNTNEKEN